MGNGQSCPSCDASVLEQGICDATGSGVCLLRRQTADTNIIHVEGGESHDQ